MERRPALSAHERQTQASGVEPLNDLMVREIRAFAARRFPQMRGLRDGRMAAGR